MVTVDGVKMGKSLGNAITIKEELALHEPMTIRFFVLSSHYRSPTDFSESALEAAGRGLERLNGAIGLVRERMRDSLGEDPNADWMEKLSGYRASFEQAMNDDFNTPAAIATLFDLSREVNTLLNSGEQVSSGTLTAIDDLYNELGGDVLGILSRDSTPRAGTELVEGLLRMLIEMRQEAREARDWALADSIRDRLQGLGVALDDGPEGTRWRLGR